MKSLLSTIGLLVCLTPTLSADSHIHYTIVPNATDKRIEVSIIIPTKNVAVIKLQMPKWAPGAYILGGSAGSVRDAVAKSETGTTLETKKDDEITWSISTSGSREVHFSYWLAPRNGFGGRAGVDSTRHAHVSGPSTYMYVVDRKTEPVELTVTVPSDWKVENSLDPVKSSTIPTTSSMKSFDFTAPNYDVLADAPVEMGDFAVQEFDIRGVSHKVLVYGNYANLNQALLLDQCKKIVKVETDFFNDVPYHRYVFMFRSSGGNGRGAGGLEHLGSTEIGLQGNVDDVVRSVSAHEFFHLWNVKRIRPFVLGPFDYTGPVHTNNLWWSEGVTSYYGDLLSRRAGLNTDDEYLKHLAQTIGQLQGNAARLKVTAEQSSYNVWDGGGSQGFGNLSYYTKGELIGLCLDLKIRSLTKNKKSLDDVIKALYAQCGKGLKPGFGEDDIRLTCNKIARTDMTAFYNSLCRSTEEMPFDECLGYAGLIAKKADTAVISGSLGIFAQPDAEKKGMTVVFTQRNANSVLERDDLITEVDGQPAITVMPAILAKPIPGGTYSLTIVRAGKNMKVDVKASRVETFPWAISQIPGASLDAMTIRNTWLTGK